MRLTGLNSFYISRVRIFQRFINLNFYVRMFQDIFFALRAPVPRVVILSIIYSYHLNFVCQPIQYSGHKFIFPLIIFVLNYFFLLNFSFVIN